MIAFAAEHHGKLAQFDFVISYRADVVRDKLARLYLEDKRKGEFRDVKDGWRLAKKDGWRVVKVEIGQIRK